MNNITWTDRPDGRQFWQWNAQLDEWVKTVFLTWGEIKTPIGCHKNFLKSAKTGA